jgi:transposase
VPIPHDKLLYRQRHKIENMFGKLKDWRRIHTRYDRCAHAFDRPPLSGPVGMLVH